MAMVDLRHLHTVTSKGKVYRYAWRGGPRLKAEFGTPAFVAEYSEAHAVRVGGDGKKLASLIIAYKKDTAWTNLSEKTRQNWAPWLDRIQVKFGEVTLASVDRPLMRAVIRKWRDQYRLHPRTADVGLQVFSRLLSFGVADGILVNNMAKGVPHLYRNDRSDLIWTSQELDHIALTASEPLMRAARLAALTGLRQGDLLRLSWSHIKSNSIEIGTGKSNERKTTLIPIYAELRQLLKSMPKKATTVLTNSDGMPWKSGFGSSWGKAVAKAGIVDLHFHDLRGTAATRFFMAGFEIREIAELMTWSEVRVEGLINRYVKRDEILLRRIKMLDEAESGTSTVKLGVKSSPEGT
jgi:integrase